MIRLPKMEFNEERRDVTTGGFKMTDILLIKGSGWMAQKLHDSVVIISI